ncbi:MAG: asparaginase [Deltaproteobacteria bacterium]|nr:MAG: asparaginase [Deltaproteobacteria bacterium]
MPRVLLLHTGGTLGMRGTPLAPDQFAADLTSDVPELLQIADIETRIVCNLDSSDIGPPVWAQLVDIIAAERDRCDGFVIVHGTDTMAYTASALSFALEGLDRPVILTGAQRPLRELRTDARRNLADAVDLASRPIPEVGICFDGLLLRGCRAKKTHMHDYRAFDSPGCEPLARLGIDVLVAPHVREPLGPFRPCPAFDPHVLVVHVTPGMPTSALHPLVPPASLRGVVLVTFGVGTAPTARDPVAPLVRDWVEHGIEVLVITQSAGWVDLSLYENSRALADAGAIAGGRMTIEAGVTKMMHALARSDDPQDRRTWLERNVAGELG